VCHDRDVRDLLVVLFWLWLLVALAVYGYRIFRRVTQGPKATRDSTSAEGPTGDGGLRARLGMSPPPPLPDGPVEARLPESLRRAGSPPPDGVAVIPTGGPASSTEVPTPATGVAGAPGGPGAIDPPLRRPTTLAEALAGIRMPADLLPLVSTDEPGLVDGRRARFGATGTNVPTVAVALGEELRRLGYVVDGLETLGSTRAGLTATRDEVTVSVSVTIDDDTGSVVAELNV
jgi:hypothetical protein